MPDWRVVNEKYGPERYAPDRLFSVGFISPTDNDAGIDFVGASIIIDRLNPPTITLQEHEKKLFGNLVGDASDVNNEYVIASSSTLSGNQRLDSKSCEIDVTFCSIIHAA